MRGMKLPFLVPCDLKCAHTCTPSINDELALTPVTNIQIAIGRYLSKRDIVGLENRLDRIEWIIFGSVVEKGFKNWRTAIQHRPVVEQLPSCC